MRAFLILFAVAGVCSFAHAQGAVFDSFDTGGIDLKSSGIVHSDVDMVQFFVDRRRVTGSGNPVWSVFLDPSVGVLRYDVSPQAPPTAFTHLLLDYRNTNGALFSIADFEAFSLEIPELTGSGYLRVTVNEWPSVENSLPELITQTGTLYYPFANMTTQPHANPIRSVQFYFFPLNDDFSVGIDRITVVPEPSGALLFLASTAILAARRLRKQDSIYSKSRVTTFSKPPSLQRP